jgi:hypothetical protein
MTSTSIPAPCSSLVPSSSSSSSSSRHQTVECDHQHGRFTHRATLFFVSLIWMILGVTTTSFLPYVDAATIMYVSSTGNDATGDGTSLSPFGSIRQALTIMASTSVTPTDNTIVLASGTYTGVNNTDLDVVSLLSSLATASAVSLTITCPGQPCTILALTSQTQRFVTINCTNPLTSTPLSPCLSLTLTNLIIIGGNASRGGCLYSMNAAVTLQSSTLTQAPQQCIFLHASSLSMIGSTLSYNGGTAASKLSY